MLGHSILNKDRNRVPLWQRLLSIPDDATPEAIPNWRYWVALPAPARLKLAKGEAEAWRGPGGTALVQVLAVKLAAGVAVSSATLSETGPSAFGDRLHICRCGRGHPGTVNGPSSVLFRPNRSV